MADKSCLAKRALFESPPRPSTDPKAPKKADKNPTEEPKAPSPKADNNGAGITTAPSKDKNEKKKEQTSGESLTKWSSPPDIVKDVAAFVGKCKEHSHLVTEKGIQANIPNLADIEEKTVTVFVVDSQKRQIVKSTKDNVISTLKRFGASPQCVTKGSGFAAWEVLLPTKEACLELLKKDLRTTEQIMYVGYLGKRRTKVTIYDVPKWDIGWYLGAFILKYGEIVDYSSDVLRGVWRFEIMTDTPAFNSIPNFMDINHEGKVIRQCSVIVSGRKPVCWECGHTGHMAAACKGKKAPNEDVVNQNSLSSAGAAEKGSPVDPPTIVTRRTRSTVGSHLMPPPNLTPSTSKSNFPTKGSEEGEWQMVGKHGRTIHGSVHQSPPKGQPSFSTDIPPSDTPQSYADRAKGGFASPGKAKFDEARAFLEDYNKKKKLSTPKKPPQNKSTTPPTKFQGPIIRNKPPPP